VFLLFSVVAGAEPSSERTPFDLGAKFGVATGSITKAKDGTTLATYAGFPIGASIDFDVSRKISLEVALIFVADFHNFQVSRTGFTGQLSYHLLGGARRTQVDYGNSLVVMRESHNLSLVLREGLQHYSVTITDNAPAPDVQGSDLVTDIGAEYRYDLNEGLSFAFDFYLPAYVLPASSEQIKASVMEVVASLRFFL
jgi:hypothetical protein